MSREQHVAGELVLLKLRWVENVARMGGMRSTYIFLENAEGKREFFSVPQLQAPCGVSGVLSFTC